MRQITAKDKLLRLLQAGLQPDGSTSLSVEFAESDGAKATLAKRGITSATSLMVIFSLRYSLSFVRRV
jgi:hypothetical protein